MKLFMVLLGCRPDARLTEQHDMFFGIAEELKDLTEDMKASWPGSGQIHIDGWREVKQVGEFAVSIRPRAEHPGHDDDNHLFFINLGGYKRGEFEEFHYKVLAVGATIQEAAKQSKETAFFKHTGYDRAVAHIDDRYGIDVDDIVNVSDILDRQYTEKFTIILERREGVEDPLNMGYLPMEKVV